MSNTQKPKIIFMGTSSFAAMVLRALLAEKYDISAVYTRLDAKVGRKQEIQKSPVKLVAEEFRLPVETPLQFDNEVIEKLKSQKPDLLVVVAYGKILPKSILDIPSFGAINVHASLLPKFRGPSPIQNALICGEKETGTTIMLMDEGVDTGGILTQKKIEINYDETYPELSEKLANLSSELLLETIPFWLDKSIQPQKQDDSRITLCQLIERADGKINWDSEAQEIYNLYRAFYSWPGIYTFWEKEGINFRLKLTKIGFLPENPNEHHIGEVFFFNGKTAVKTGAGLIYLEEVQMEGKNKMSIDEFNRGMPNFVGSILK